MTLPAAKIKDGYYRVKDGITREVDPFDWSKLIARIFVIAFAAYLILATTNCAVQEGVKIYEAIDGQVNPQ